MGDVGILRGRAVEGVEWREWREWSGGSKRSAALGAGGVWRAGIGGVGRAGSGGRGWSGFGGLQHCHTLMGLRNLPWLALYSVRPGCCLGTLVGAGAAWGRLRFCYVALLTCCVLLLLPADC